MLANQVYNAFPSLLVCAVGSTADSNLLYGTSTESKLSKFEFAEAKLIEVVDWLVAERISVRQIIVLYLRFCIYIYVCNGSG